MRCAVPHKNRDKEGPSAKVGQRPSRRKNNNSLAKLQLQDKAKSTAQEEVVSTPDNVQFNTGIASAPPSVSPVPAEEESYSRVDADDPLLAVASEENWERCRICYRHFVVDSSAKDLFDPANGVLIFHIEVISGVWIKDIEGEPKLICPSCQLSVQLAIEFREMCIRIELQLTQPKIEIDEEPADPEAVQEDSSELDIVSDSEYSVLDEYAPDESVDEGSDVDEGTPEEPEDESLSDAELKLESVPESPELGSQDPLRVTTVAEIAKDLVKQCATNSKTESKPETPVAKTPAARTHVIKIAVGKTPAARKTKSKPTTLDGEPIPKPKRKSNPKTKEEKNHMRNARIRAKPANYVCDQCGQAFRIAQNLQIHILRHSRTKNYQCTECPMTFYDAYMRNIHIRIKHRGETPFRCRHCAATFSYAAARQKHEKVVHGVVPSGSANRIKRQPGPKPRFDCELCDKHYVSKYALAIHVKSHTNAGAYKCKLCVKCYNSPAALSHHMNTHSGKRPLQCKVCQKGFYQQEKLREHELIHTGERPYRCELCDVYFRYKYNMKVHGKSKMHQENLLKAESNTVIKME